MRKHYPSDPKPVIGTFELISDDDNLEFTFHSAQVIPIGKSRNGNEKQLAEDVAQLRTVHAEKPTVRQARETLKPCGQSRAIRALNAFDTADGEAVA